MLLGTRFAGKSIDFWLLGRANKSRLSSADVLVKSIEKASRFLLFGFLAVGCDSVEESRTESEPKTHRHDVFN